MSDALHKFLSAFFSEDDPICLRVFSDRKNEEPDYKGNKFTEKLNGLTALAPVLKQHNAKNRGVFFVVNSGGHNDADITQINAQFVESGTLSFDEQMARIDEFPLPPSVIVKTQKSLHAYWLMQPGESVLRFREIQLLLIKHFNGDIQCQNESRVLRLPGFNHCKGDPVAVELIKLDPSLRYTQAQLAEHLPEVPLPKTEYGGRASFDGTQSAGYSIGSGQRILESCAFMQYCRGNAATLPEPMWYALVSNLSLAKDGAALVHEFSKPYPKYKKAETNAISAS